MSKLCSLLVTNRMYHSQCAGSLALEFGSCLATIFPRKVIIFPKCKNYALFLFSLPTTTVIIEICADSWVARYVHNHGLRTLNMSACSFQTLAQNELVGVCVKLGNHEGLKPLLNVAGKALC